jgi:peptidoglycan/LPS O-acetylase OafA/YrhL
LTLSAVAGAALVHRPFSFGLGTPWMDTLGFGLVDIIAASILLFALRPGNVFYRVFSLRPLRELGKVSYGFYVFHAIPIELYNALGVWLCGGRVSHVGFVVGPIALLGTTALAFLSFHFVESPFLRLKDHFTK